MESLRHPSRRTIVGVCRVSVLGEHLSWRVPCELDPFDRVQLAEVVRVCRGASSLSEAGRELFAASRRNKRSSNDADRLRKYLARFGLTFDACARGT